MPLARVKPSKESSLFTIIGAVIFVFVAGFFILSTGSGFVGFLILMVILVIAFGIIFTSSINLNTKKGIATTEIDLPETDLNTKNNVGFDEKLRRLQNLKKDNLITEEEFKTKRQEIISQNW